MDNEKNKEAKPSITPDSLRELLYKILFSSRDQLEALARAESIDDEAVMGAFKEMRAARLHLDATFEYSDEKNRILVNPCLVD
jgi:hypothetical protein